LYIVPLLFRYVYTFFNFYYYFIYSTPTKRPKQKTIDIFLLLWYNNNEKFNIKGETGMTTVTPVVYAGKTRATPILLRHKGAQVR